MPRKKSPLTPPVSRRRAYELPNLVRVNVPQDPITEIENQNLRDLSNEYRVLRLEEMLSKKRQQISKGPTSGIQGQRDILETFKVFSEIQKINKPSEGVDKTLEYLKFFNTMMQGQGSPGFFEQYARAKELGIMHDSDPGNPNKFSVEMEKLRGERMLTAKKIDLELTKLRLEQANGQDKLAMLANFLSPFVAIQGNKMADGMRVAGRDMAGRWGNPNNPGDPAYNKFLEEAGFVKPSSLQGETAEMRVACDCGYDKTLIVPVPPPASISCPGCKKTLLTGPQPGTGDEEGAEWRRQA